MHEFPAFPSEDRLFGLKRSDRSCPDLFPRVNRSSVTESGQNDRMEDFSGEGSEMLCVYTNHCLWTLGCETTDLGGPAMPVHDVDDLIAEDHARIDAVIVHQATGILMVRRGTNIDEATAALHEASETIGIDVTQVAASIVGSTHRR